MRGAITYTYAFKLFAREPGKSYAVLDRVLEGVELDRRPALRVPLPDGSEAPAGHRRCSGRRFLRPGWISFPEPPCNRYP